MREVRDAAYLRGVMVRAATKLEDMPPHLKPVHVAQSLRAAVDASLGLADAGARPSAAGPATHETGTEGASTQEASDVA